MLSLIRTVFITVTMATRCGLLHETIAEWEVVVGNGDVVVATATNEHADLHKALPLSHGSLGDLFGFDLHHFCARARV